MAVMLLGLSFVGNKHNTSPPTMFRPRDACKQSISARTSLLHAPCSKLTLPDYYGHRLKG